MKIILLSTLSLILSIGLVAQCTPDHDFEGAGFGLSPDANQGETFVDGEVNTPYSDVLHVKVPTSAGDISEGLPDFPVDSVSLESVLMSDGGDLLPASEFGFDYECNNSGTSPNPCNFMGGQQGCVEITGLPQSAVTYNIVVEIRVYVTFGADPISEVIEYDGYTITIDDGTSIDNVGSAVESQLSVAQNYPNPFTDRTEISVNLPNSGDVSLLVRNLIGEDVFRNELDGIRGQNKFVVTAQDLKPGIYIYTIEFEGSSITKRMVLGK